MMATAATVRAAWPARGGAGGRLRCSPRVSPLIRLRAPSKVVGAHTP